MPKLTYFLYADAFQMENYVIPGQANAQSAQRAHIVGPVQVFTPLFVPCLYSFVVSLGLIGINYEKDSHTFRLTFASPVESEALLIDTGDVQMNTFGPNPNHQHLPDELKNISLNLDFRNVPLRHEGEYTSTVYVDGVKLGSFPIQVVGVEGKK